MVVTGEISAEANTGMESGGCSSPEKFNVNTNDLNIPERGFYACYLLHSLHQRAVSLGGRTYIGFTVDPRRRIRQHNGLLTQGAYKTRKWRPWDMALVVHGFQNQRTALQFEWTWQHAETSLDTREAVLKMKDLAKRNISTQKKKSLKLGGAVGQILILFVILSTPPWKYFPLHIRFMSGGMWRITCDAVMEVIQSSRAPRVEIDPGFMQLPEHISVSIGPLEDFSYDIVPNTADETEELITDDVSISSVSPKKLKRKNMKIRCVVCCELAQRTWSECQGCGCRTHVKCLAEHSLQMNNGNALPLFLEDCVPPLVASETATQCVARQKSSLPRNGVCPMCCKISSWEDILGTLKTAGWKKQSNNSDDTATGVEEDMQVASTKTPTTDKIHQPALNEARTPLESLILKTRSISLEQDDEENLAQRMLRRLREQEVCKKSSPCTISVAREEHGAILEKQNKENFTDTIHPIVNLCSSEEGPDIIDLVDESPRSVESKVNII